MNDTITNDMTVARKLTRLILDTQERLAALRAERADLEASIAAPVQQSPGEADVVLGADALLDAGRTRQAFEMADRATQAHELAVAEHHRRIEAARQRLSIVSREASRHEAVAERAEAEVRQAVGRIGRALMPDAERRFHEAVAALVLARAECGALAALGNDASDTGSSREPKGDWSLSVTKLVPGDAQPPELAGLAAGNWKSLDVDQGHAFRLVARLHSQLRAEWTTEPTKEKN